MKDTAIENELTVTAPPLPVVFPSAEATRYPIESLGSARAAVEEVQRAVQLPAAIPAASALAAMSVAVMSHADVETLAPSPSPVALFFLTVAKSSDRKSSADKLFTKAIQDHEREAGDQHDSDMQRYRADVARHKKRYAAIMEDSDSGVSEEKTSAALTALGSPPEKPPIRDLLVSDPTLEGMIKLFGDGANALGLFTDEGGQFFGGYSMSKDHSAKTQAAMNKMWDGGVLTRTRADVHVRLYGKLLSAHLMVQPVIIDSVLADQVAQGSGFLARFLISWPESLAGHRPARPHEELIQIEAFNERMREVLSTKPTPPDSPPEILRRDSDTARRVMRLSTAARAHLVEYYTEVEEAQQSSGKLADATAVAGKSPEQACRIAGVMTLWDDLMAKEISGKVMADAIQIARYHLRESVRNGDKEAISQEAQRANQLQKWLAERPKIEHINARMIGGSWRVVTETGKLIAIFNLLVEHGWLVKDPESSVTFKKSDGKEYVTKHSWSVVRSE